MNVIKLHETLFHYREKKAACSKGIYPLVTVTVLFWSQLPAFSSSPLKKKENRNKQKKQQQQPNAKTNKEKLYSSGSNKKNRKIKSTNIYKRYFIIEYKNTWLLPLAWAQNLIAL